jgi:transcriptional regulator with XRE-family HTH domain
MAARPADEQGPAPSPRERRRLGLRLRDLRRVRGLTTRELSDRAGLSPSMINQLETGKTGASVTSLRRIAAALDVPIAEFFLADDGPSSKGSQITAGSRAKIVRRDRRKRLQVPESNIVYELLTPDLRWDIEFVSIELQPGQPPVESMSHPGQECCLVLSGTLTVVIGDDEFELRQGDSIAFDSSLPHHIENRGAEPVVQVSAITPPRF